MIRWFSNRTTILLSAAIFFCCSIQAVSQIRYPRPSPGATVTQSVGVTDITIKYSRPGVKGRAIWGGLVPLDTLWRTGANEATTITFTDTVRVEGKLLPAGTYGLATIPGRDSWTIVFNKKTDLWGTMGYDQSEDALRVTVKPGAVAEPVEWMRFTIDDLSETSCKVVLTWEKLAVAFKVDVDTKSIALSRARAALGWQEPMRAANYALQAKSDMNEAMKWINMSMMVAENYSNMRVKAQILAEMGKTAEAIALMEQAVTKGKAQKEPPFDLGLMEQKLKEWKSK